MKKIISTVILCILCALSFYGCSGQNDNNTDRKKYDMNMVIGKIEAINGNEIVLMLADTESMLGGGERPTGEMPENFSSEDFEGQMPEGVAPEDFEGERPELPEGEAPEDFTATGNGEKPDKEMPQGGGKKNFDASSLVYSGETETYTVPEGMKIGDEDYTSLEVEDVIIIKFDIEGGISEITLMPSEAAEETTE